MIQPEDINGQERTLYIEVIGAFVRYVFSMHWTVTEVLKKRTRYFYCPQTKFTKVMFLHLSVCPQGGGQYLGRYPPGQVPPSRYTPGQVHPPPQTGTPLGRYTPGQVPPATVHAGIWSTSGQYASHWNAFLYTLYS